ncbi:transglutaminase domain-containing protein [Candidatus Nanohalococcus occultus]|uniref:Transglutaminase-like domain-containing protein n=1 Tax=Candidatus Nanohalococcus occultus TaxID=2978047 RepID=A0ABY8CJ74_9ARCH|nr:hypothetical protein SVXNc_0926 [Candidatus Nanohaloarchaeota archaeon SVXNc]
MPINSGQFRTHKGIKFLRGISLDSSSKDGYSLKIPSPDIPSVEQLHREFSANYNHGTDFEAAEKLSYFIAEEFEYEDISDNKNEIWLTKGLQERKGVCKEQAATYQVLAQRIGLDSEYLKGTLPMGGKRYRHAWNKVETKEGTMLADPTNNRFGEYSQVKQDNNYIEGEQLVSIRPDQNMSDVRDFLEQ